MAVASTLMLVMSCKREEAPEGSASFSTTLHQALSAADVTRVAVTLTAADIPAITIELTRTSGVWGGAINNIRAGTHRTFTAEAFDADGTKLFEGQAPIVTIEANKTTNVVIILHPINKPTPFENEAPLIDSLVVSTAQVEPGGTLSLRATAHDPNPGDPLTYAWTATGGSFDAPGSLTTVWTAPTQEGDYTLTLTITDPMEATAAISFKVRVQLVGRGTANVTVKINTWPQVARVTASPTRVNVGEPMMADVTATDNDGDSLTYHWTASCPGSWTSEGSKTAQFTPSALPGGTCNNCQLTVTVSDTNGGSTTGKLDVCISPNTSPVYAPTIESAYQSSQTVSPGNVVRLYVHAQDPQGKPLSFKWSANVGILGSPVHSNNTSEVRWTSPVCIMPDVTPTITVTATNQAGLTATTVFTVTWNGERCDGSTAFCFAQEDYEGHWLFETSFLDASAHDRHLDPLGGATWVNDAIWGQGIQAAGGYIAQRPSDDDAFDFGNRNFTIMAWVKRTNSDSYLLSKASDHGSTQGWSVRSYWGRVYWYSPLGTISSGNVLENGVWHHVAIVRNGEQLTLYIDGAADASRTLTGSIPATTQPLRIGQAGSTGLNGSLDEVVILGRAATALEVASAASRSCR